MQSNVQPSSFPVGTSSDSAVNRAAAGAHGAVDKAATAADEVVRKAKPVIDRVATGAHHVVDKAASVALPAARWVSEQSDALVAGQARAATSSRQYVSANPLSSVAIAFAAGVLIARILRPR
jgi:ElaB/YqjD/DUF883 family membrane-anchored ribosome-binding protein